MKCPAFNVVVINDTVVINRSIDPLFMKGDMLLSVNGIPVSRMLPYAYEDRYNRLDLLMRYYYFSYPTSNYTIRLIRNGSAFTVNTSGEATDKAVFDLDISEQWITISADIKMLDVAILPFPNSSQTTIACSNCYDLPSGNLKRTVVLLSYLICVKIRAAVVITLIRYFLFSSISPQFPT